MGIPKNPSFDVRLAETIRWCFFSVCVDHGLKRDVSSRSPVGGELDSLLVQRLDIPVRCGKLESFDYSFPAVKITSTVEKPL